MRRAWGFSVAVYAVLLLAAVVHRDTFSLWVSAAGLAVSCVCLDLSDPRSPQ